MRKEIDIFTDGACFGNPGPGGIGAILQYKQYKKTLSQGYYLTTNNRMELRAVIEALALLKEPCVINLYTDSQYLCNGMTKWIFNWKKNNWQSSQKKPVKNKDLWILLDEGIQKHQIHWHWVKGHAGHEENEICDQLAKEGANHPTLEDPVIE